MKKIDTFKEKLYECEKHVEKIIIAKKYLLSKVPLTIHTYINLNDIEKSFIDQLIFRFSKLQDTLGEKIFPGILLLAKEEVKKKTFLDILNRVEELEIVETKKWLQLRETRNEIAHEYSFNIDDVVESIMRVYHAADELVAIYSNVRSFCQTRLHIFPPGNDVKTTP